MGDKPPPYTENDNNAPSAPPSYLHQLPGEDSKGVDWSLNSRPSGSYSGPGPSVPSYSETESGSSSKGIDWSINRPAPQPPTRTVSKHPHPFVVPTQQPGPAPGPSVDQSNHFARWKENFSKNYPGAKFSRDNPSVMKVEIPKNRAFPPIGYAACPDCFDIGPHQTQYIKKKDGFLSSKKMKAQKCRRCSKLTYFEHSDHIAAPSPQLPRDKPPPYTNRPSQIGFNRTLVQDRGHGWGSSENLGHGWDPGDGGGHGWG